MNTRFKLAVGLSLAASLTSFADVKVNDTLTVSGYAAGSYRVTDPDPGEDFDRLDIDAVKTMFTMNYKPVTGNVSFYYQPESSRPAGTSDVTVLDAFATVDVGGGSTVTFGKFLSYMGYEAFDIVNMSQITYANGDFLGAIPGYHTGVKYDFSDQNTGFGLAVVDSVFSGPNYLKGDGELKHNAGFEGYFVYKGIPDVTLWFGAAYDTMGNVIHKNDEILTLNFWGSYNLTKQSTLAVEFQHKDGGRLDRGYNWLAFYNQAFDANFSTAFRVSGEKMKNNGPEFIRGTVSPSYKVNDNFLIRGEVTYTDYDRAALNRSIFVGLQTVFKF